MWHNLKAKAYMTVEAAVVIPMMLFIFVAMMYMLVFAYDSIILMQDTYMMTVYAKEEYMNDKDKLLKNMNERFSIVYEERPYLSFLNLSMNISKAKKRITINSSGTFFTPFGNNLFSLFDEFDREINCTGEIILSDPAAIMLKTKDILGW